MTTITTWDPFRTLEDVQSRLDRLMRRWQPAWGSEADWAPAVDVKRVGDELLLHADLPGVQAEDVTVEVEDGVLTVSGHRGAGRESTTDEGWIVRERATGAFARSLTLPTGADAEHVTATFADGVLEVTVPVPPAPPSAGARQIPVEAKTPALTPAD